MSLPVISLDEITPDWVSQILKTKGHDVRVSFITPSPIGTGQVGATFRLSLDYTGDSGLAPRTLVAKLPSLDPLSRTTGKTHLTYIRESRFYQQFAGTKPMDVPDHYYIAFDEDSHDFSLIMEDFPMHYAGNQLNQPSDDEAMLAMDAAAKIHAAYWGDSLLDRLEWPNGTRAAPPPFDIDALYQMFWPAFCDRYHDRISQNMQQVGDAFMGKISSTVEARQSPRCLTHNDYRADNMLFAYNDHDRPIVIVDWQTTGVGVGVADVAYYIGTSFDLENRRRIERALLERYKTALRNHNVAESECVHLDTDFALCAVNGFLMGVTASMVVERTERGDAMFLAMAERSAAMVIDHKEKALPK